MTKLIDLKDHKTKKKAALIAADLEDAIKVMDLSIRGLTPFAKYIQVMETISNLQNNKTLLAIHLAKYQRLINEDHLEKTTDKDPDPRNG